MDTTRKALLSALVCAIAGSNLLYGQDPAIAQVRGAIGARPGTAVRIAAELRAKSPDSVWTLLASATPKDADATAICKQAMQKAKDDPTVLELATLILTQKARESHKMADLIEFLAAHRAEYEANSADLIAEADAWKMMDLAAGASEHQGAIAALLNHALQLEPDNVPAIIAVGNATRSKDPQAAYEFFKAASARLPQADDLHTLYWETAAALPNAAGGDLEKEIVADATKYLTAKKPGTSFVYTLYAKLEAILPTAADAIAEAILRLYPDTEFSDQVAVHRAGVEPAMSDPETAAEAKIAAFEAFIDRPKHYDNQALETANSQLGYLLSQQDKPDAERLYRTLEALRKSTMDLAIPAAIVKLADAEYRLKDLDRIAVSVDQGLWQVLVEQSKIFLDPAWVDFMATNRVNLLQDAMGWVYFHQGRLDESLEMLNSSLKMGRSLNAMVHRGQVYAARKEFTLAEADLTSALEMGHLGAGQHPAVKAFRNLYVLRNGSTEGLEAYMSPILAKEREQRHTQTLAARIKNPKDLAAFKLVTLDGKTITSDQFKGKTLVINFWATWCGPCRHEMPDLERFYQKYKDDPSVAMVAVSTDTSDTPDAAVQAVIQNGKYQFPVLRGPDYATQNHISAIPVTWFVDPSGKLAFAKLGATSDLVEEFTWRLDALKGEKK